MLWLGSVLHHNASNAVRHHRCAKRSVSREVPLTEAENGSHWAVATAPGSPREDAAQREEAQLIGRVLAEFPGVYQEAVRMRIHEHASFKEIGARLGCSESGASRMLGRVMSRLADHPQLTEIRRNWSV